jgi:hypothetical protein
MDMTSPPKVVLENRFLNPPLRSVHILAPLWGKGTFTRTNNVSVRRLWRTWRNSPAGRAIVIQSATTGFSNSTEKPFKIQNYIE